MKIFAQNAPFLPICKSFLLHGRGSLSKSIILSLKIVTISSKNLHKSPYYTSELKNGDFKTILTLLLYGIHVRDAAAY